MRRILLAGILALAATAALAHARLATTAPADGTVLAAMPGEIVLTFSRQLRLTRVRMSRGGEAVDLDLAGHGGFAKRFAIPVAAAGAGAWRVEWRGLAADGHAMRGAFTFRVE